MNFNELCSYRDLVLSFNNLAERIRTERQRTIKSPGYNNIGRSPNKGTADPTERKALLMCELTAQLEAKQKEIEAGLPAAQAFINFYCADEPEAGEILSLYFIKGLQPWQVRNIAQERKYKYDTLDTICWLSRMAQYKPMS